VLAADAGKEAETAEIPGKLRWRFVAFLFDTYLCYFLTMLVSLGMGPAKPDPSDVEQQVILQVGITLLNWFILTVYLIVAELVYRTTIGKYAMGLELASARSPKQTPTLGQLLLRETVGKFCCSLSLGGGFLRAIRDPRKQGWHDRLAKTVVRKRATHPRLRTAYTVLGVLCTGFGLYTALLTL
jgi:uncharacterized RDD family membrane protein YckC